MRGGVGLGEGPCAAQPPSPPPAGGRLHLRPPSSASQFGKTALDLAKEKEHPEVVRLMEICYLAAQVGCAAPRRA